MRPTGIQNKSNVELERKTLVIVDLLDRGCQVFTTLWYLNKSKITFDVIQFTPAVAAKLTLHIDSYGSNLDLSSSDYTYRSGEVQR